MRTLLPLSLYRTFSQNCPCPQGSSNGTQNDLAFGYVPTEWVCITFLSLFGISTCRSLCLDTQQWPSDKAGCAVSHTVQALYFRFWWLIPSAIFCGLLELTGWSGRLWSSQSPTLNTPYVIGCVYCVPLRSPVDQPQGSGAHHRTHSVGCGQFHHPRAYYPPAWPAI